MHDDRSQQTGSQQTESSDTPGQPRGRGRRRLVAGICSWGLALLAAVAIVVFRRTDVLADHGFANIGTLIAGFVLIMSPLLWLALCTRLPRWVRFAPLVGFLAFQAVFHSLFRIESVSGELEPRFVWRFSARPDELLERPDQLGATVPPAVPVDLLSTTDDDIPQFLGPQRSNAIDRIALADDWAASPPRLVWRQPIGAGWSGFAVVAGHALTMEQRAELEMVTCYNVADGRLEWSHATPVRYDSTIAGIGPRATPTVDEGRVYTLGATGELLCLDGATGSCLWQKDLLAEFGMAAADEAAEVSFGRSNSPLVLGDLLIVPAGGTESRGWVSLVAYDKKTGERVWQGGQWQISYASPVVATLGGVEQVLIVNQDYASGHDPRNGNTLWTCPWPGRSSNNANVSQAVAIPPDRVFLSKGYTHGASLMQLVPADDGTFEARQLWHDSRVLRTKFTNVCVWQGYVYGLSDGILECVELESGRSVWKKGRYRHGQIFRVGQRLLVLSESGEVILVEASPERPNHVLGRFQAIEGQTWNTFALYGPNLLVRNAEEAACYRLPLAEP